MVDVFSMKRFIENARSWDGDNVFKNLLRKDDREMIHEAAVAFVDQTNYIMSLSTAKVRKKPCAETRVLDYLEGEGVIKKAHGREKAVPFRR